jgi:hypothetical protein
MIQAHIPCWEQNSVSIRKKRSGNRLLHFKVSEILQKQRIAHIPCWEQNSVSIRKKGVGNRLLHFKVSEMLQKQRIVTDG